MKRISPKIIDNFNTDLRSSQQSCHVSKSKPLISTTPLQQQKSSSLIQSLNGLCKYFNQKEENKQITYYAPKSMQRSSASLSPREIIAANIQKNNSPLLVKQLLNSKNNQKENFNSKVSMSRVESKQQTHLSIEQDRKLIKVNDSSNKKCMGKLSRNQNSRNESIQYHEDWKLKYEDLQQSLCERIQQLEFELENMEKNKKMDQMHSDEQTNQYIEKLQYIVSEKDQVICEKEQKSEKLQNIINMQQKEIQKYKEGMCKTNEIQRLQQIDQKFQQIKGYLPSLNISLKNIQQIFDVAQSEQQVNNLSLSSFSMVEMINDFNQVIEESSQKSFKKQNQKEFQFP